MKHQVKQYTHIIQVVTIAIVFYPGPKGQQRSTAPRKQSAKKGKSSKTVVQDPSPIESCNPPGLQSIAEYLHPQPAVDSLGSDQAKVVRKSTAGYQETVARKRCLWENICKS